MPAGMTFFQILGKVLLSAAIGYASNVITNALFGQKKAQDGRSPTYSFGPMATQTNSNMAIPIIYGKCKAAGNNLWQPDGESSTIYRLIGLGEGKVHSISDVKLNDVAIGSLSGCSYTAYLGDGTQNIDSRVPGATNAARAEVVGGMKYDAYLAITATASDQLTGNFNMTCVVEGREVRVYSNLTTYSVQYSRNPAWCILDFLTAYNGCGLSYSDIDLQSFLDAAAYCDEVVDGQARFTLNLVLDEKRSRLDWLAAMCLTCQAYPVYQNGKHGIKIEKYELPAAHFDIEPDEAFEIWESKPEEIFDRVKVIYVDPAYESTRVGAPAEVTTSVLRDQVNTRDLEVLGVDNFKQASRLAWFYANQANTCTTWAKYTTNRRALNRTIGDIITTTDPVWGLTNQQWRIMEMVESQDGRVEMGLREYNPALYTDTQGSVAPTVLASNLDYPWASVGTVQNFAAVQSGRVAALSWDSLYGASCYEIRQGGVWETSKIIASTFAGAELTVADLSPGSYTFMIKAIGRWSKYGPVATATVTMAAYVPNASGLSITEDTFLLKDGTALSDLTVTWTAADYDYTAGYNLYYELNNSGIWVLAAVVNGTGYTIKALQNTTSVKVKVVTVDRAGQSSSGLNSASYTITGKSAPPSDVTGFSVGQSADRLIFSFSEVPDIDVGAYEIREGLSVQLSTLVTNAAVGGRWETNFFTSGDKTYWIRALDRSGNLSVNPARFDFVVVDAPRQNIVYGVTKIINASLPGYFMDEIDFMDAVNYLDAPSIYVGYFNIDAPIDFGEIITSNVMIDFDSSVSSGVSVSLEMRTSIDGVNYGQWQQHSPGSYTFRAVDARVKVVSNDHVSNILLRSISITIDVPDKPFVVGEAEITSAGWTALTYPQPYYAVPLVGVAAQTVGAMAYTRNATKTGCEVLLVDSITQTAVTGTYQYNIQGY